LTALSAPKSSRFRDARFDRFLDALKAIQDFTFEQTLPNVEKQLRIIWNGSLAFFASCLIALASFTSCLKKARSRSLKLDISRSETSSATALIFQVKEPRSDTPGFRTSPKSCAMKRFPAATSWPNKKFGDATEHLRRPFLQPPIPLAASKIVHEDKIRL